MWWRFPQGAVYFFNIYRRSLRRQRFGKALTFTFSDIRNFHRRSASLHVTINGQKKKKKSVGILRIGNRVASDVHNRFETLRTNGDGVEMTPLACSGWKTLRSRRVRHPDRSEADCFRECSFEGKGWDKTGRNSSLQLLWWPSSPVAWK